MAYQYLRRFYIVVGGGHMKGRDVLAMDVRVGPGFKEDRENFGMIVVNRAIEGRVILKVSPMIGRLNIGAYAIDVAGFAGLQKSPTGYGLLATGFWHRTQVYSTQVIGRQYFGTDAFA